MGRSDGAARPRKLHARQHRHVRLKRKRTVIDRQFAGPAFGAGRRRSYSDAEALARFQSDRQGGALQHPETTPHRHRADPLRSLPEISGEDLDRLVGGAEDHSVTHLDLLRPVDGRVGPISRQAVAEEIAADASDDELLGSNAEIERQRTLVRGGRCGSERKIQGLRLARQQPGAKRQRLEQRELGGSGQPGSPQPPRPAAGVLHEQRRDPPPADRLVREVHHAPGTEGPHLRAAFQAVIERVGGRSANQVDGMDDFRRAARGTVARPQDHFQHGCRGTAAGRQIEDQNLHLDLPSDQERKIRRADELVGELLRAPHAHCPQRQAAARSGIDRQAEALGRALPNAFGVDDQRLAQGGAIVDVLSGKRDLRAKRRGPDRSQKQNCDRCGYRFHCFSSVVRPRTGAVGRSGLLSAASKPPRTRPESWSASLRSSRCPATRRRRFPPSRLRSSRRSSASRGPGASSWHRQAPRRWIA